MIMFAVDAV